MLTQYLPDETEMLKLAAKLAVGMQGVGIIFLQGPLGAGKTTFSRGFLQGLGYAGKVKSPTYTIVEPYHLQDITVFHFDFYRIQDPHELELIGIRDYFHEQAICLIEWPECAGGLLPNPDLSCYIEIKSTGREIKIMANSERGQHILLRLKE